VVDFFREILPRMDTNAHGLKTKAKKQTFTWFESIRVHLCLSVVEFPAFFTTDGHGLIFPIFYHGWTRINTDFFL